MKLGNFTTAQQARDRFFPRVSTDTVRRALKRTGARCYVKRKKPALSKRNMEKRRQFAREHARWDVNKWKRVIFSDETQCVLNYNKGRQPVWDLAGRPFSARRVQPRPQTKPAEKVMIWACMGPTGVLAWEAYTAPFNADKYINILKRNLRKAVTAHDNDAELVSELFFQDDNAPQHRAERIKKDIDKLSEELDIEFMEWPPKSPDLNPIENFWSILKQKLRDAGPFPDRDTLLFEIGCIITAINAKEDEKRERGEEDMFSEMYKSMPHRMRRVLENKGGSIEF
jgi:hypothetical protein